MFWGKKPEPNSGIEYSSVVELAETVRCEAANLSELASFRGAFGHGELEDVSPEVIAFVSRVGEEKVKELRRTLRDLSDFLWHYCSPSGILKLGHRRGPSLLDETKMACAILRVFVPDIPEDVMERLSSIYMHDAR
ncbi:MAG: hypothetical protein AB3N24_01095 [Leisingera sp.]